MKKIILLMALALAMLAPFFTYAESKLSPEGIGFILGYESFRAKAYKCPAGRWTLAYGETKGVKPGQTITEQKGFDLFMVSIIGYEFPVQQRLTRNLPPYQYAPVISLAYNRGSIPDDMMYAINTNNTKRVVYFFSRYNRAKVNGVSVVLKGLDNRRKEEIQVWKTGKSPRYKHYNEVRKKYGYRP